MANRKYKQNELDYTQYHLPVVRLYTAGGSLLFDSTTLNDQPISVGTDLTEFSYKFTDELEKDDECRITFETNNIPFLNHPLFQLEQSFCVSWGWITPEAVVMRDMLRLMIRDIDRDYSSRGIKMTLTCTDNFAALKKEQSPELMRAGEIVTNFSKTLKSTAITEGYNYTITYHDKDKTIHYDGLKNSIMTQVEGRTVNNAEEEFLLAPFPPRNSPRLPDTVYKETMALGYLGENMIYLHYTTFPGSSVIKGFSVSSENPRTQSAAISSEVEHKIIFPEYPTNFDPSDINNGINAEAIITLWRLTPNEEKAALLKNINALSDPQGGSSQTVVAGLGPGGFDNGIKPTPSDDENNPENIAALEEEYSKFGFGFGKTFEETLINYFKAKVNFLKANPSLGMSSRNQNVAILSKNYSQKPYKSYTLASGNGELLSFHYNSHEEDSSDDMTQRFGIDPDTGALVSKDYISDKKLEDPEHIFTSPEQQIDHDLEQRLFQSLLQKAMNGEPINEEETKLETVGYSYPTQYVWPTGVSKENKSTGPVNDTTKLTPMPQVITAADFTSIVRKRVVAAPISRLMGLEEAAKSLYDQLRREEETARFKVEATIVGDPFIMSSYTVKISGLSEYDNGTYFIESCTHKIGPNGYTVDLEMVGIRHVSLGYSAFEHKIDNSEIKKTLEQKLNIKGIKGKKVYIKYYDYDKKKNVEIEAISDVDNFADFLKKYTKLQEPNKSYKLDKMNQDGNKVIKNVVISDSDKPFRRW